MARLYVGAVIALGLGAIALLAPRTLPQPRLALACLAAMVLASLLKLRLPLGTEQATVSMAYVVDFVVLLTLGVQTAVVIAAVGALVQCRVRTGTPQPWCRAAFSVAAIALSVAVAGATWEAVRPLERAVPAVALLLPTAAAYFMLNSGLVAGALSLAGGTSWWRCWRRLVATAPGYVGAAALVGGLSLLLGGDALLAAAAAIVVAGHLLHARLLRQLTLPPSREALEQAGASRT